MTTAAAVTWRASEDGTAHAHGRRATRTACDQKAIDPRFAWPQLRLCEACVAAIKREAPVG